MSHLTQMLGLTVHNFLSAATGLAMAFALVRGFVRSSAATVGDFLVDLTRIEPLLASAISVRPRFRLHRLGRPPDAGRRRRRNHPRRGETDHIDRADG